MNSHDYQVLVHFGASWLSEMSFARVACNYYGSAPSCFSSRLGVRFSRRWM